jgi:hypothetical protein
MGRGSFRAVAGRLLVANTVASPAGFDQILLASASRWHDTVQSNFLEQGAEARIAT